IKGKYITDHPNYVKWKLLLSKSNGTGEMGERLSPPEIASPFTVATQTFISFGSFDSEYEAISLSKYLKTKFVRLLLGVKKITPDNARKDVWELVPNQNCTKEWDINWNKTIAEIDKRLYEKYELSHEEIQYIEDNVRAME